MITSEKNRLEGCRSKKLKRSIGKHINFLEKEKKSIAKESDDFIDKNPLFKDKETLLKSVPGVGNLTARTLISELPELGQIPPRKISTLAGLAPLNRDSGKVKKKRFICGGRSRVRKILYMASLSAMRCNPILKDFSKRLKEAGKPFKVIITAVMHKLLIILNAMVRDQKMYVI